MTRMAGLSGFTHNDVGYITRNPPSPPQTPNFFLRSTIITIVVYFSSPLVCEALLLVVALSAKCCPIFSQLVWGVCPSLSLGRLARQKKLVCMGFYDFVFVASCFCQYLGKFESSLCLRVLPGEVCG